MADPLDFSVQLRLLNDNFNQGVNQARDRFGQLTQSIERNLAQMNTDTERAQGLLTGLGNVSADRLTAELKATADQLRQMGAGANLSGDQIDAAMQTAAQHVIRLGRELEVARSEAVRLSQTNASPAELAEAAARVNRLEQELGQARTASTRLSDELAGAMNRAGNSADAARNAIYRITNIRVPETIRAEIDQISRSLVDFQNNSGRPAAEIDRVTRAAEEQIRRLEAELNGLDDTQDRVNQGSNNLSGGVNRLKGAFGGLQGLLAAAGLGIGVAEIIETADAFKTLEARIKLATGEGAAFTTGFAGVKQIANETFSSIESTGELFTRISQAAESLGIAQTEVLGVTRTINEAIKLSGGSAASADAAITQLIQGLQSGVVRGEEFNSIMEQAPRLAQAMADGLGVTRGALRELAADGKLTSEVVINSVQSQGAAISKEFATLPNTVGNSLQVLKNQLFNFVGEIDGTLQQSSKLADAISLVGDSLEDLDPSTIAAINGAIENTLEAVKVLGRRILDNYNEMNAMINAIAGGASDANEQVGLITASLHGVSIFIGAIADGFKALEITALLVSGVLATWVATAAKFYALFTFGKGKEAILEFAATMDGQATAAMERINQKAMEFDSSFSKSFLNASKTAKERFAEIAAESEKTYNKMIAGGTATAEAIEGQLVKMVQDRIKANDMMVSDEDRLLLAQNNLQVAYSDTGEVSIEAAKLIKEAVIGIGESFAEVAHKAEKAGTSIELSFTEAIQGAKTAKEVNDIIYSLEALENQGVITGQQVALFTNIAMTKYENLDKEVKKNIETFALYASEQVKKTNNVVTAELQRTAALRGLAVQADKTGTVTITQLDETTAASERTKEQIDELAGAVGVGLSKEFLKSKEGVDALIDGFDDLEGAGYDAGGALVNALTDMANKAQNTVEIENLRAEWIELGREGRISAQELEDGLYDVDRRANQLAEGINSVTEAYGFLGIKTREELAKSAGLYTEANKRVMAEGKLTAQQQREVFEKTAKANIAANGGVIDSFTRAQAAALGFTVAVDENGRVAVKKMGEAKTANDKVTSSVRGIKTAYDGISGSAGGAGNSMVRAANNAMSAYDKLQAKIKKVKEAQAVADSDKTLRNLRIYGKEEASSERNQFGSRLGVENFLKSSGLSAERATEEARKIYAKQGTADGALNTSKLQGFKDGQVMTNSDIANFKSASVLLSEIASKAKVDEARRSKYEAGLNRIPDSALRSVSNLNRQPDYSSFGNNNTATKTIDVNFKLGGASASMSMPENQEGALMALLQSLQESKAIAGY